MAKHFGWSLSVAVTASILSGCSTGATDAKSDAGGGVSSSGGACASSEGSTGGSS